MEDNSSIGQKIKSLRGRAPRKTENELRHAQAIASYAELPIGRLATELLTDIFALAVEENEARTLKSLGEVCRIWENITVASPRLNAIIKYPMSRNEIQTAVKRAKDHPLTVIYMHWHDLLTPTRRKRIFLEEACRHSKRWRSLKVRAFYPGELDGLMDVQCPLLEVCEVEGEMEEETEINLFRGAAPLLRRLVLHEVSFPWRSTFFTSNLRSLDIATYRCQSPGALLAVLAKSPRLVSLDCYIQDVAMEPGDPPLPSSPVVLDDLTHFSLKIESEAIALTVLSNVKMRPSVRVCFSANHVSPGDIAIPLATQFAYALTSEDTRVAIELDGWFIRIQLISPLDQKPLFDVELSVDRTEPHPGIISLTKLNTRSRPITLSVYSTFGGFTDEGSNVLESVLTVMDTLPDLDRLALDGAEKNRVAEIIEHLSYPRRRGGSSAEWSCPKLENIEMHGCSGDEPATVVRLVKARSSDYHQTSTSGPLTSERGATIVPVAISKVVIGRGSAMDEASFSTMEQILGEGKVHWCWKMDCSGTCIESSRQDRGY